MSDETPSTLDLNRDLRQQLLAEAEAEHRTVDEFLGELLRVHRDRKQKASEYDIWFDSEIEQALREADDPLVPRIPDQLVRSDLERRVASLRDRT